jgi:two-component system sensor histidine kinase KdpD
VTVLAASELEVARWTALQGSVAGAGAGPFAEVAVACFPILAAVEVRGVLAVQLRRGSPLRADQRELLEALCRQTALALERVRLAEEVRAADLRAEAEQLRSALLSSVSHDLRTPLATITGAATTLRDGGTLAEATRRDLVEAICDEAERLERLVRNLLDMTRLESGTVQLHREWVPVEELVGSALTHLERGLSGRPVTVGALDQVPLVAVDPVLLEQLLVNLLENAAKYTPRDSPIEISGGLRGGDVWIEVADRGPGLPAGMEEQIFERFRRGAPGAASGVGLGLAIARAIARAHAGTLVARNRSGGGAVFTLTLPPGDLPAAQEIAS